MANDINRLIDMIYERIEDAKAPALKPSMSIVDRDELLDLLDELRAQLPAEIKRAQELLAAREKARQIVTRAEERSRQLYQVANSYAEDALARTEEAVQAALDEVKQSRVRFRTTSAAKMQEQRQKLEKKNEENET